jgi:Acetyl co-enzyme A carboxylase carboxyltransferase alpha subunit
MRNELWDPSNVLRSLLPSLLPRVHSTLFIHFIPGHGPQAMLEANYGMASPHGYRTAMRLMQVRESNREGTKRATASDPP